MSLPEYSCHVIFSVDGGSELNGRSESFTLTPGVTPNFIDVDLACYDVSALANPNGTMLFGDGKNPDIALLDCRIVDFQVKHEASESGFQCSARIADHRWRWAGKQLVTGEYNARDAKGDIIETGYTKKSACALATMLLQDYLDEYPYEVDLPDDDWHGSCPYVRWNCEAPAQALQDLCDIYGAVVCFGVDNHVYICRPGKELPGPGTAKNASLKSDGKDMTPIPETINIYGAPRRFEVELELQACAMDTDGQLKSLLLTGSPLAPELSYLADYYQGSTLKIPRGIAKDLKNTAGADATKQAAAMLCDKSLFRWYWLPDTLELPITDEGHLVRSVYAKLLKAETNQLELIDDNARFQRAYVTGDFQTTKSMHSRDDIEEDDDETDAEKNSQLAKKKITIDALRGIVKAAEPYFRVNASDFLSPPRFLRNNAWNDGLKLRCVLEYLPSLYSVKSNLAGAEPGYIENASRPDFQYRYDLNQSKPSNQTEMDALAESYVDEIREKHRPRSQDNSALTEGYAGIHCFSPDGVLRQVTWNLSMNAPPTTTVSYDREHNAPRSSKQATLDSRALWAWKQKRREILESLREITDHTAPETD